MKQTLSFLLAIVFLFTASFLSFTAVNAAVMEDIESVKLGDSNTYYSYSAENKTLTISGSGAMPDMKNNADSQPWYDWRSDGSIERVVIEEGVTAIGNFCFYSVKASDFSLPDSLQRVGRSAFAGSDITSAALPFGLTALDANAFDGCGALSQITLPDTLTSVGAYAFRLCGALQQVRIPYSVAQIGTYAFDRCTGLHTVLFEDLTSDISLMNYAFYDCPALRDVALPARASLGRNTIGRGRSGALSDVTLQVYDSTDAHIYALTNQVTYTLTDGAYPLYTGVPNTVTFDENTWGEVYSFLFTPAADGRYHFYAEGDCDTAAALLLGDETIAENDDMSVSDRSFAIEAALQAGRTYTLQVRSMHSAGSAQIFAYSADVTALDVRGTLEFEARDGFRSGTRPDFPITDTLLSDFVLSVHFADGFTDFIYYRSGTFNLLPIGYVDTQRTAPFTCGDNTAHIALGDITGSFCVHITHTYQGTVVPYTAYEDGYTVFTCMLCKESYIGDVVESPAITVSGRCFLQTDQDGTADYRFPLSGVTVEFGGNTYAAGEDGRFSFRTLDSGTLTVHQPYAPDKTYVIENDLHDINFGAVPMPAYDFNRDGYINGRDLAYFKIHLQKTLGRDYFSSAVNFM